MYRKWVKYLIALFMVISLQAHAVEYELADTQGQTQSLEQYRGKWVIVNYWATWCTSCLKELPDLISFHDSNKNRDVVVVGVNFEDIGMNELNDFIKQKSIPYTVLSSKPAASTPLGPVPALPTTYIINPEGHVVAGDVGLITQKDLEDFIALEKAASTVAEKAMTHDDAS
jgi:peroxiredoxin